MTNFVEHSAFGAPPPLSPWENNAIFYFKKLIFVDRIANFKFSKWKIGHWAIYLQHIKFEAMKLEKSFSKRVLLRLFFQTKSSCFLIYNNHPIQRTESATFHFSLTKLAQNFASFSFIEWSSFSKHFWVQRTKLNFPLSASSLVSWNWQAQHFSNFRWSTLTVNRTNMSARTTIITRQKHGKFS